MPRLSQSDYVAQYQLLRKEWVHHHGLAFSILSPTEQILLHDFYEPSKRLTDAELKVHRAAITKVRPTLPQQAGKAFARIAPFFGAVPVPIPTPSRGKPYSVKITSLVNPEIDPKRIAKILIDMARENRECTNRAA